MTQVEFNVEALRRGELICRNSSFCLLYNVGKHGKMFGGDLMKELDLVCGVFAAEVCDTPLVFTKRMDIEFVSPLLPNQIFKTYIGIKKIGNTSLTFDVEIRKHSVSTEKEILAVKCNAIFVRVNEDGEAIKISDHIREKFGFDSLK